MQKLTLILVIGALGLAGWQTWEAAGLRDDLAVQEQETLDLQTDVARLSKEFAGLRGVRAPAPLVGMGSTTLEEPTEREGPTLAARGASPEVLARAVRDLQDEVSQLRQRDEEIEEKVGKRPPTQWRRPTMIHNPASATKVLDLSPGQRADLERVVDYTKRDLDDLHSIRNDEGKTWKDVSKVTVNQGEGFSIMMPDFAAMRKFKSSRVPGSNETFGEAEGRIRERGNREVKDILTPEQQKTFDGAHTTGLFGRNMNTPGFVTSVRTTSSSSSND